MCSGSFVDFCFFYFFVMLRGGLGVCVVGEVGGGVFFFFIM